MVALVLPGSAAPWVRELLSAAPDGAVPVLHDGEHAVYVAVPGPDGHDRAVGVVAAAAAAVPCAIRVRTGSLSPVARARVTSGVLHLDGTAVPIGRLVDVGVPALRGRLLPPCPVPAPGLAELAALPAPDPVTSPEDLLGRGSGLTPLGDDVLCGWLVVHRAAGRPVRWAEGLLVRARARTTLLSATLLECAARGEALPELRAWLAALGTPAEPAAAAALTGIGHTSGAGLLHGARLALHRLRSEGHAAA